jgi:hypothetical protein
MTTQAVAGGTLKDGRVGFYDYTNAAHISGTLPNLYHYGEGTHLNLKIKGSSFDGYDYGFGSHFSGSVHGNRMQLYDYSAGSYS